MRKTKIICTMGPSTDKGDVMEQLVREGMDVARFNFSHGPHDEQRGRIQKLRELRKKYDRPVAALLDTKGPEIRLGCFKDGKVSLEEGQIFTFTNKDIEGTNECVSITYKELYKDVQPGGHILVDDGLVDLEVQDISGKDIVCKVINAGVIGDRKGVNVPGANLKMPFISKKDHEGRDMSNLHLEEKAEGSSISEEDRRFIADFYKYSFVGLMLDLIKQ